VLGRRKAELLRRSEQTHGVTRTAELAPQTGQGGDGGVTANESPSATSPNASLQEFQSIDRLPIPAPVVRSGRQLGDGAGRDDCG
jgi:hypothetical protein